MAYGHSVCALAARAGLEPATAGASQPQALTAELPRFIMQQDSIAALLPIYMVRTTFPDWISSSNSAHKNCMIFLLA